LLKAPDGSSTLVGRLAAVAIETWPESESVLVGPRSEYVHLGLDTVHDDPADVGPIGGLRALLQEAAHRDRDTIALACDLPYVNRAVLARLAPAGRDVDAVAPRIDGIWQPLCAFYRARPCLDVVDRLLGANRRALRGVLEQLAERAHAIELDDDQSRLLRDWDSPGDVPG
jgi:molybdopterin-guanine dinucleotide biosynthesis protein A